MRVIRAIAVGSLDKVDQKRNFVASELKMALGLSLIIGSFGYCRAAFFTKVISMAESVAIAIALMLIVLISVVLGALLPLFYQFLSIDPANSSTTIQVIMDISGVIITCMVANFFLETALGKSLLNME